MGRLKLRRRIKGDGVSEDEDEGAESSPLTTINLGYRVNAPCRKEEKIYPGNKREIGSDSGSGDASFGDDTKRPE